ncbi:hypothetical protein VTL71DRAFT_16118 [Oculimacula yallundae]|uniref:Uncharacterized protein n=1 Tax=Oculimacula yallundae TaxID=86028 RepID=A0ABR4CE50_9HELO
MSDTKYCEKELQKILGYVECANFPQGQGETKQICGVFVSQPETPTCANSLKLTPCGTAIATAPSPLCFTEKVTPTSGISPTSSLITSTISGTTSTSVPITSTSSKPVLSTSPQESRTTRDSAPISDEPSSSTASNLPATTDASTNPSAISNGTIPSNPSSPASKKQGITSGAAAGIGIGGALAGAAVAALILFFLFGRYKKRRQQHQPNSFASHLPEYTSDIGRQEKSISTPTKTGVILASLPQPAEDDAIIGELSKLRDSIKNHVQSFYTVTPISTQSLDFGLLGEIANDTGLQVAKLQHLLSTPASQTLALRLCIAWIILSRSDGRGPASTSLLSEEAASVAALISSADYRDSHKAALASKMKVISGALLQTGPGQAQPLQSANLEQRMERAVSIANGFLTPFIDPTTDASKRLRNMQSFVRRASNFAMLLFSQPSSWAFDFGGRNPVRQGSIVVFPGLLETVNEDGMVQQPPRQFYQPEVMVKSALSSPDVGLQMLNIVQI